MIAYLIKNLKLKIKNSEKGVSLIITLFTAFYIFFIRRVRAQNNVKKLKTLNYQKGVSLIITLFIMIIILAVVVSISTLLYSEMKVMRNIGNSVVGLYSADSGIEKVLYYDRQVQPSNGISCRNNAGCSSPYPFCVNGYCVASVARGLCAMIHGEYINTTNYCNNNATNNDSSTRCKPSTDASFSAPFQGYKVGTTTDPTHGCDLDKCDDCSISFDTILDDDKGITYSTTASVYTEGTTKKFEISSKGFYAGAGRQIQIVIDTNQNQEIISNAHSVLSSSGPSITNASVVCDSNGHIQFSATVTGANDISSVTAFDKGNAVADKFPEAGLALQASGNGKNDWSKPWNDATSGNTYNFSIKAFDSQGNSSEATLASTVCATSM